MTNAGWNMLGVNFDGLNGAKEATVTASLNEVLSGDFSTGDQVQCYDQSTGMLVPYSYRDGSWWYGRNSADVRPISSGTAFWLQTAHPIAVTIKGAVYKQYAEFASELRGYQLVTPDAPLALELNGNNVTWENLSAQDEIQIADENGRLNVYWYDINAQRWMFGRTPADVTIQPGQSFWLKTSNPGVKFSISKKEATSIGGTL